MGPTLYVRCVWCLVLCFASIPPSIGRQDSSEIDVDADFRDTVRKKLVKVFEKSHEDLIRVLWFLDENDKLYQNHDSAFTTHWKTFQGLIDSDSFEGYAQQLADDTKTAKDNPRFLKVMHDIYENGIVPTDTPLQAGQDQGFDLSLLEDVEQMATFGFMGLARAWRIIPENTKAGIVALLPHVIRNDNALMAAFGQSVGLASQIGSHLATIGLDAVYLVQEALTDILRWWNGEIPGEQCAKNIVDVTVATVAGYYGSAGGAALGTLIAGPFGTIFGGFLGGAVSSSFARFFVDRLTQQLFDLPKSEALVKAYNYLRVRHTAPNAEVNSAFRRLCLIHHPDKGGDLKEYYLLQNYMAVIRVSRGEV